VTGRRVQLSLHPNTHICPLTFLYNYKHKYTRTCISSKHQIIIFLCICIISPSALTPCRQLGGIYELIHVCWRPVGSCNCRYTKTRIYSNVYVHICIYAYIYPQNFEYPILAYLVYQLLCFDPVSSVRCSLLVRAWYLETGTRVQLSLHPDTHICTLTFLYTYTYKYIHTYISSKFQILIGLCIFIISPSALTPCRQLGTIYEFIHVCWQPVGSCNCRYTRTHTYSNVYVHICIYAYKYPQNFEYSILAYLVYQPLCVDPVSLVRCSLRVRAWFLEIGRLVQLSIHQDTYIFKCIRTHMYIRIQISSKFRILNSSVSGLSAPLL
jgi:hypothetical protein